MKRFDCDTDLPAEFYWRLQQRLSSASGLERLVSQAWLVTKAAESHLLRLRTAERRLDRAKNQKDKVALEFERQLIHVLLYELSDHVFMAARLLDFDRLELQASQDGKGLSGESAAQLVNLLTRLNDLAGTIINSSAAHKLSLDFSVPLDEKEGLTYEIRRHWQEFVSGSPTESFRQYFLSARAALEERLKQVPKFWRQQTIRRYLQEKNYTSLLHLLEALTQSSALS